MILRAMRGKKKKNTKKKVFRGKIIEFLYMMRKADVEGGKGCVHIESIN